MIALRPLFPEAARAVACARIDGGIPRPRHGLDLRAHGNRHPARGRA